MDKISEVGKDWKLLENGKHAVSNFGDIANIGTLHKVGYRNRKGTVEPFLLKARLSANTYYITFNNHLIHRLVASEFVDNPFNYTEVNHKDGNKANNHYSNLEWCTRSQNVKHAYDTNLNKGAVGELSGSAKLTWDKVDNIRKFNKEGISTEKLSNHFNVGKSKINKIIRGEQWKR